MPIYTNRLTSVANPYLKQHAHNPVAWHPWDDTALQLAKAEDKPILLSIGYAACHWCHVMAHESFSDPTIAAIMNKYFINIKVDKEERPDLDKIYQTAHYLLTQQPGGWPLTVFLTPNDLVPFFSGTYFPPQPRFHLPAFSEVLLKIAQLYAKQRQAISIQNEEILSLLRRNMSHKSGVLNQEILQQGLQVLTQQFDFVYGGFGQKPKFPQPSKLNFLLQQKQIPMVLTSLKHMAQGGIYDQLGGGFFRYTVDQAWQIPHFEKMLYDNAQLIGLYAKTLTHDEHHLFKNTLFSSCEWLMQKMQSAEGGYYTSLDADAEGEEGKYYIWQRNEIAKHLNTQEYTTLELMHGLTERSNFAGGWHLHLVSSIAQLADRLQLSLEVAEKRYLQAQKKLLALREQRKSPALDNKILTSWNALLIKGMLLASLALDDKRISDSAQRALRFIQNNLWREQGLLAVYMDSVASTTAYLDDYIFLIEALLLSLQQHWQTSQLKFACELADKVIAEFYDKENGGFFFTAEDQATLIYRPKIFNDDALPSANGVAINCFLLLGYLLGEPKYLHIAEETLQSAASLVKNFPAEHCSILMGLAEYLNPSPIVIIRGEQPAIDSWQRICWHEGLTTFAIPNSARDLPPGIAAKTAADTTCAYVCQGTKCSPKIVDIGQLQSELNKFAD